MYKLSVDSKQKILKVRTAGMFHYDEARKFTDELESILEKINTNDYILIIDARKQMPSARDALELQERAINIYVHTQFKRRYSYEIEHFITFSQIRRIGMQKVFDNIIFVKSVAEIEMDCKKQKLNVKI